ncbi:DnaJ domain-containing protein [Haloglomus halophilum]|uniref:DnaJ domain-containing protein n=1 Tax=Haloglomus halophilum TaxID=2962672 RepID=UPI0020C985DC|nr:DnaJ domain-containing protein [Haloglomus halophilum]
MDTGWLLVGVAGLAGGLALVLVGAGIAVAPLLLPVGLLLAAGAYLAWAAGSARIVATVYEEVGDPERSAAADGRTGRPEDRTDPDGNWRSTAADGGAADGRASSDRWSGGGRADASARVGADTGTGTSDDGPGPGERLGDTGAAKGRASGGTNTRSGGTGAGLGPDGERIWDADERDRVGGWDDWDADWEWADRHWRSFQQEYDGQADDGTERGTRSSGAGSRRERHGSTAGRAGARQRGRQNQQRRDRQRHTRPGDRGRARREPRTDRRAEQARELLGVAADADPETIREAYRTRVKEVHPDRGGDPERFKRVQWAYEYLTED